MRLFSLLLVLLLSLPAPLAGAQDAAGGTLLKVVALSRHGVRAPTQGPKTLRAWSQKPWPVWPVKKGGLTERGARLVTAMWKNFRRELADKGLLPAEACPPYNAVYIRADVDERTRATAWAMIQGLGPGCSLGYAVLDGKVDPVFHPIKAGLYQFSALNAVKDVIAESDGGLEAMQDRLRQPLELLESVTGPPSPEICERFSFTSVCSLTDLPNAVSVSADGENVKLVGSLGFASDIAEIFLLEYGQWPGEPAGWGMVNKRVLSGILPLHSEAFDLINRAPRIAWARGGFLLSEMTKALRGEHEDQKINEAKLVIFAGHDTNLANIGGLLELDWKLEEYPQNGTPPASVMFFELWDRGGKKEVEINYYTQSMEALHSVIEASDDNLKLFGPVPAAITSAPASGKAVFELDAFAAKAGRAYKGAPMAKLPAPRFYYGPPQTKAD